MNIKIGDEVHFIAYGKIQTGRVVSVREQSDFNGKYMWHKYTIESDYSEHERATGELVTNEEAEAFVSELKK